MDIGQEVYGTLSDTLWHTICRDNHGKIPFEATIAVKNPVVSEISENVILVVMNKVKKDICPE